MSRMLGERRHRVIETEVRCPLLSRPRKRFVSSNPQISTRCSIHRQFETQSLDTLLALPSERAYCALFFFIATPTTANPKAPIPCVLAPEPLTHCVVVPDRRRIP